MSKLDKKKEFIGLLKAGFGLGFALNITIFSGILGLYYKNIFDIVFAFGVLVVVVLSIVLFFLLKTILKNINDLEDL